jgi:cytochrome c
MDIAKRYPNDKEYINRLALKVINGGADNWGSVPMTPHPDLLLEDAITMVSYIMSLKAEEKTPVSKKTSTDNKRKLVPDPLVEKEVSPGDMHPLESVHPSFNLAQVRPGSFEPKVGGMDFMPDGRLVVSTWDSLGSVYILEGVQGNYPEAIKVKRIATGLAEPLGVKVVDNEIYVMQKQELTKLVDLNEDDIIDEYQTICNGWKVSANFHEFAFGLVYKNGYFYGTLATAINNGGASTQPQAPDRGKVVKISKEDGSFSLIASGLRTPNGIGLGIDNEIFIADNQGDWLPANKIVHLQEGAWYGSRSVDFEGTKDLTETPPVVWLQHHEIGNSPSEPTTLNSGPYKNQMIHGDVRHGGIKRVFVEKVNGTYQGEVFRFTQGLEAGVNRLVWGPEGELYIGGVGLRGGWAHNDKRFGLQKLTFNNKVTFEMLAVRAKSNGIEIEFTDPLKEGVGSKASDYSIKQWWYKPTADYGGPKMNEEKLKINNIQISFDRRKVFLQLQGMKPKHVVYIRLNRKTMVNSGDRNLWSTEAWYTLNNIPSEKGNLAVKN